MTKWSDSAIIGYVVELILLLQYYICLKHPTPRAYRVITTFITRYYKYYKYYSPLL